MIVFAPNQHHAPGLLGAFLWSIHHDHIGPHALIGGSWVIEHWALGRTRTTVATVPDGPTAAHIAALLNANPYPRH